MALILLIFKLLVIISILIFVTVLLDHAFCILVLLLIWFFLVTNLLAICTITKIMHLRHWWEITVLFHHLWLRLIVQKFYNFVLSQKQFYNSFSFFLGQFMIILSCVWQIWSGIKRSNVEFGTLLPIFVLFIHCLLPFFNNLINNFLQMVLQLSLVRNFSFKLNSASFVLLLNLINHFLKLFNYSFKPFNFLILCFLFVIGLVH